jgi:hypothetical protein
MLCAGSSCCRSPEVTHRQPPAKGQAMAEVPVTFHFGLLTPDHLQILQLTTAVIAFQSGSRHRGPAAAPPHRVRHSSDR